VEGQLAYLGSERFTLSGAGHRRSAWALGGSALGGVALGESFAAYGKLGAHWVRAQTSGPLSSGRSNDLEVGVGAGLHWQMSPASALRLELENIGGHGGDLLSLGLHLRL
jgi:opacity protein-like surface antigen